VIVLAPLPSPFVRSTRLHPIVSLTLLVLFLGACQRPAPASTGGRGTPRALPVHVAPVEVRDVVFEVQALGSLEAEELVQVTAEVEGAVAEVRFHEGDRVRPSQVLLRIDPERYALEEQRAEAGLAKAMVDAQRARQDLERRESLARDQLVSTEDLNRSRGEATRLASEAAAARAARDWAAINRQRADVKSPKAGTIDTRAVSTGQFVRPGTVLATLVDTSRLRLRFKVSESESLRARVGELVAFRVAALGARAFQARVYHVGELADAATRQVEVLAWVKNPGELKPGFFAEVTLASETHANALLVPEGAVQASEKGFVAFVVDGGKVRSRSLKIGQRAADGSVEILSGLQAGEQVVIEGSDRVAEGVSVQALETERPRGPATATPATGNAPRASAPSTPRTRGATPTSTGDGPRDTTGATQ
jgi:multidrug efflux system membrane fusion protein